MRKRKMNIRNTVTPDPIDFYMEIKERKTNTKGLSSKRSMRRTAAAGISFCIDANELGTAGISGDEAC